MALQRIAAPSLPVLTSLNGTKRTGVALQSDVYQLGTLILDCACAIVTGSVVATFGAEGSVDGTTWVPIKNISNVTTVTFSATGTVALAVPMAAYSFQQVRAVATLSGATTAGGDTTTVTSRYIPRGKIW
jgi:hypothetical protein